MKPFDKLRAGGETGKRGKTCIGVTAYRSIGARVLKENRKVKGGRWKPAVAKAMAGRVEGGKESPFTVH